MAEHLSEIILCVALLIVLVFAVLIYKDVERYKAAVGTDITQATKLNSMGQQFEAFFSYYAAHFNTTKQNIAFDCQLSEIDGLGICTIHQKNKAFSGELTINLNSSEVN